MPCICILSSSPRNTLVLLGFTKVIMPNVSLICIILSSLKNRGENTNYVISLWVHKSFGTQFE